MKILSIDTSAKTASVALTTESEIIAEFTINNKLSHSEHLMPMINQLFEMTSIKQDEIDLFAVSNGPGSFTGLRIGVTAIKAMAYVYNKPVVGVNTLDALAYNIGVTNSYVCPMLDARNNQVFTSVYKYTDEKLHLISEYMALEIAELAIKLKELNSPITILGDGAILHEGYLVKQMEIDVKVANTQNILQRAASVAFLAYLSYCEGKVTDSFSLVPFYLRKSQAEQEYDKRNLTQKI